ncbi:MAG: glycosyl hydrolase, partial [Armatimonadota bacterium]
MSDEGSELLSLLRDPPAAYRPAMFWLLNGRLTPERMREQIRQMHERGCGGFFLHPMGEAFRLRDFIAGIDPPYLSDEYFALIRLAVEEADRLGIYAWLYDEGGWPSGTAQGRVVAGHPELRGRVLGVGGDGELVAQVTLGGSRLRFTAQVGGYPVDTLNPATAARFIELTHERYAQAVGEFFGGTIPGMFTDEVAVGGRVGGDAVPWSPGLLEQFERRRGFDLTPWLPALFGDEALGLVLAEHFAPEDIATVRCEFCELWTELFREAYFEPINRWCAEHGLLHTGHVGGEDDLRSHAAHFGHFF